jgi:hypothetical protein
VGHMGKGVRIAALLFVGGVFGYLIGPPIASAATSVVTIQGAGSTHKAKVLGNGRLEVSTEAPLVGGLPANLALTAPYGEYVLMSVTAASASKTGLGDVTGVSLDVTASTGDTTMVVRKGSTVGAGMIIWQGTVPAGPGNLTYTFEDGLYLTNGFNVVVSASSGSPTYQFEVYGDGFGVTSAPSRTAHP